MTKGSEMKVTFYNFPALHNKDFQTQILERYKELVENNAFIEGKYNQLFESEFAALQKSAHCLLLANGTDAIEIALQALGIKAGDHVGIAGISFFATAEAVITRGAIPVFIDVDPQTGLMCTQSLKRTVAAFDLKAIIPVHIYGQPAPIAEYEKICHPKDIAIIEDAAQAQGGFYESGEPIGSSDNLCTFSFYPTKNLGAFGDAGAILTQDEVLAEDIVCIRNHGRSTNGFRLSGRNSRCDHLQAAVLHLKLANINKENQARKEIEKKYIQNLEGVPVVLPKKEFISLSSWHLFRIGLTNNEERTKLKDFLATHEIGCSDQYYNKALGEIDPIEGYPGERENAIKFAQTSLCLPMHAFLTDAEITFVTDKIKEFYKK